MKLLPTTTTNIENISCTLSGVLYKGDPLFFTKPIGEALGFSDITNSILHSDFDEGVDYVKLAGGALQQLRSLQRGTTPAQISPMVRSLVMVTEPGLYMLLFKSKKPIAKQFRKWVTGEVLPAIRKTGSYTTPRTHSDAVANELEGAIRIANFFGLQDEQARISANRIVKQIMGTDALQLSGAMLETPDQEEYLTPTQLGAQLGLSAQKVNLRLKRSFLQARLSKKWVMTEKGKKYGKLFTIDVPGKKGSVTQLRWRKDTPIGEKG